MRNVLVGRLTLPPEGVRFKFWGLLMVKLPVVPEEIELPEVPKSRGTFVGICTLLDGFKKIPPDCEVMVVFFEAV